MEEAINGARVVKAFVRESHEKGKFEREGRELVRLMMRAVNLNATFGPLMNMVAVSGVVIVLWLGGRFVIGGELSIGALVAFVTYFQMLVQPTQQLPGIMDSIASSITSGERLFGVLDTRSPVRDLTGAHELTTRSRDRLRWKTSLLGTSRGRAVLTRESMSMPRRARWLPS